VVQQSSNPVIGFITLAALVAISVLVRRGRLQSRRSALAPRERIRPLAITLLDPVISVIIIGPFVAHFVRSSSVHLVAAVIGAVAGVAIGYWRARVMFVRSLRSTRSVVLRRSGLEYALVGVLIVLRTLEGSIDRSHSAIALSALTALATLALVEAIARSYFIVDRYRRSPFEPLADGRDS